MNGVNTLKNANLEKIAKALDKSKLKDSFKNAKTPTSFLKLADESLKKDSKAKLASLSPLVKKKNAPRRAAESTVDMLGAVGKLLAAEARKARI